MAATVIVSGTALAAILVATSACGSSTPTAAPASTEAMVVTIGVADDGRNVALVKGQRLHVVLRGDATRRWSPVTMTGTGLTRRVDLGATPTIGTTLALFEAVMPGEAELASTRPLCEPLTSAQAACHAQQSWKITVVISA
jgi:hypothetical protein